MRTHVCVRWGEGKVKKVKGSLEIKVKKEIWEDLSTSPVAVSGVIG